MAFELPALPYDKAALEPYIDAQTMEIHHGKHHQAYVTNLNNAIAGTPAEGKPLEDIVAHISQYPMPVRNNGGGHLNHSMFWKMLAPAGQGGACSPELQAAIDRDLGGMDKMKEDFAKAAAGRFGSGWAWVIVANGTLAITSTPNQDNPLMDVADVKGSPILGLDVWEHAYYLKYQNRRPDYVSAFWSVVNWAEVSRLFAAAK